MNKKKMIEKKDNFKPLESNWELIKSLVKKQVGIRLFKYKKQYMFDDAVDHVLFCIVMEFSRFDSSKSSISTWVYRISNYRLIDFLREKDIYSRVFKKSIYHHVDLADLTSIDTKKLTIFDTGLKFEDQEFATFIWDKFLPTILNNKEIHLLRCRYFYNMKNEDIAKEFGFTKSYISRYHAKVLNTIRQIVYKDECLKMELLR